jgi:hypothetical protein
LSLAQAERLADSITCPEILILRKHFSKEVRSIAQLIGNETDKIEYMEMEDILGFGDDKAIKIALIRVKNAKFNTDDIEEENEEQDPNEAPYGESPRQGNTKDADEE